MNDLSAAVAASGHLSVDLADLYLHPLNTRSEPPAPDISQLADSILACGLMQNLLCYIDTANGDGPSRRLGVVAGGRRFRALRLLAGAGQWTDPVPVQFTTDPATAQVWANAENTARTALHPADEIRAYGRMEATGAMPLTIARAFAVTEAHVKRRLRLSHLPDAALDALQAGTLSLDQCAALTLGEDPDRRAEVLDALLDNPNYHADWIRRQLVAQGISAGDRRARFVGLARYEAEGGRLTRDLFTDAAWLHDESLLDKLFARTLKDEAEFRRTDGGWAFEIHTHHGSPHDDKRMAGYVQDEPSTIDLPEGDQAELEELSEIDPDDLTEEQATRLADLESRANPGFDEDARAGLGIMVHVDWQGRVRTIEGLRERTASSAPGGDDETGDDETPAPATTAEPDISQALREDFLTIRRCALQTALLLKPELLLDFIAFTLDWHDRNPVWGLTGVSIAVQNVHPGVADGLAIVGALQRAERQGFAHPKAADFRAFRDRDDAKKLRNQALTIQFARAIVGMPGDLTEELERLSGSSVRAIWQPDARNCFGRMSTAALVEAYRDCLQPTDDDDRFAAFAAMSKKDKVRELDGLFNDLSVREAYGLDRETGTRIDAWVPAPMRGAGQ